MRCTLIWLIFLCEALPAWAVNPNVHISQYGHKVWRIQDGFLDSKFFAIAQTADGYLWFGGLNGPVRFDGVRFVPWTPPPGKQLPSPEVASLLAARDWGLWIGTSRGLSHRTNHDLVNYSSPAGSAISSILEDEDGTIWVVRSRITDGTGPLCHVKGDSMQCYGKSDGIPDLSYVALVRDSTGDLWLGGDTGLTRWRPGSFQTYYPRALKSSAGQQGIERLLPTPDGSLLVGMIDDGPDLGLEQFSRGAWKPFVVPELDGRTLGVTSLFRDHQNAIWVGTYSDGIYRIYGNDVDHFDSSEGLSNGLVYAIDEDSEGNLWVATATGIDCFRDLQITTFSTRERLTAQLIDSVLASRDGTVWIGGGNALDILDGRNVSSIQRGKGLPGTQVTSLFEDHAGQRWVGIENTLNIYEDRRFTRINRRDGSPVGTVLGITEDPDRNIWVLSFGPPRTLIRIYDRKVREEFAAPKVPAASSLVADHRGGIWLGLLNGDLARYQQGRTETFRFQHTPDSRVIQMLLSSDGSVLGAAAFGLIGWSNGKRRTLNTRNGLPCESINAAVEDDQGTLWLYMACGLVEIPKNELQHWWAQPDVMLHPKVFDVFDGLRPGLAAPFEKQAARTPDGRLWFVQGGVLQMIDPAHLGRNLIAPPVYMEQIIADRKKYPPQGDVRLPARTRDVEIDYTALSLAVPQKVRFRYRLEGRDMDWQEAGTRRQAFYTDLRPRTYRFHVIACNNDGVWNEAGALLDFSIAPAYYQTNWFRALCGVAFLMLLWALYQFRLRQLHQQFAIGLEASVSERFRIARELHDTLLQSFQGLLLRFQAASNLLPTRPDDAKKRLDIAINQASQAIAEGRDAIQGLRSSLLVTNDLALALRTLGEELLAGGTNPQLPVIDVAVEGEARGILPTTRDEVYRISAEALRNAFRHAQAKRIEVEIRYGKDEFQVRIRDDGKGIGTDVSGRGAGHFGLYGMRERAKVIGANLEVWSSLDSGAEVQLTLPSSSAYEVSDAPRWFRFFRIAKSKSS